MVEVSMDRPATLGRLNRRQLLRCAGRAGLGPLVGCGRLPWQAQPRAPLYRVGYLSTGRGRGGVITEAFFQRLREHGYVEGQNLIVEYRAAEFDTDRLPELTAELVRLPVDVIVAAGAPAALAAARETQSIPIVAMVGD